MEGVPFIQQVLTIMEVLCILENLPRAAISASPQKPKAGQMFAFKADNPKSNIYGASEHRALWLGHNQTDDWRCYEYKWINQAVSH